MAKCKMCDKKGIFLKVSKVGLCEGCNTILFSRVTQTHRIMSDCIKIIDKSNNLDTKLSRCDLLLSHINDLIYYEDKGITTIHPAPSELAEKYTKIRNDVFIENARLTVEKHLNKANKSKTPKTKIKYAKVALEKLNEFKASDKFKEFEILENRINDFISECA